MYFHQTLIFYAKFVLTEEEEEYQDNDNQNVETASVIKDLTRRLDDLQACNDLIFKQGSALQRALSDLETLDPPSPELTAKFKTVSERATLFRIAANAMISVSFNKNSIINLNLLKDTQNVCETLARLVS